tara:strand:+ start:727 stop:1041 length:315 start_codon:yes stop_codon:yes gene_type:complete
MKKSLIIFTFLLTFSYVNAQKNRYAVKKASNAVALISSEMELSDEQTQFLEKTLYTKYAENGLKIKGKDLSQEEKKKYIRKLLFQLEKFYVNSSPKMRSSLLLG